MMKRPTKPGKDMPQKGTKKGDMQKCHGAPKKK